jgi:hypothetical protein
MMAERPDWHPAWPEVPEGHEVIAIIDPDWDADAGGTCMWRGGAYFSKACDGEAVATLLRGWKRKQRWRYCPEHMYGRWVEAGFVMHWILVKSAVPRT